MAKVDKDELARLYKEGMGINRLAAHFGVRVNAIFKHVKNMGLADHSRMQTPIVNREELARLHSEGLGHYRLSLHFGVNQSTIAKHLKALGINDSSRQFQPKEGPRRVRRPKSVEFTVTTKSQRFAAEQGCCQWCKKPIGDGTKWGLAVYHHILPVIKGGTRDPENCMVLHSECHNDPEIFEQLHGFNKGHMEARWACKVA